MRFKKVLCAILLSVAAQGANAGIFSDLVGGGEKNAPDSPISVGFSTDHSAKRLVLEAINGAQREIRVAAYSFTSKDIANALVSAKRRGVDVMVVVDKSQESEKYTSVAFLANMGVPVRVDHKHAIQHEKTLVIDREAVETGSFNFTDSADKRNAENAIVIRRNPQLASYYLTEWALHWNHSEQMNAKY